MIAENDNESAGRLGNTSSNQMRLNQTAPKKPITSSKNVTAAACNCCHLK